MIIVEFLNASKDLAEQGLGAGPSDPVPAGRSEGGTLPVLDRYRANGKALHGEIVFVDKALII